MDRRLRSVLSLQPLAKVTHSPTVLSSTVLQSLLFYNCYYSVMWTFFFAFTYRYKYLNMSSSRVDVFTPVFFSIHFLIEPLRLYSGFKGNLKEATPEFASFLFLTVFPALPLHVYMTCMQLPLLPVDVILGVFQLLFLVVELLLGWRCIRHFIAYKTARFLVEYRSEEDEAVQMTQVERLTGDTVEPQSPLHQLRSGEEEKFVQPFSRLSQTHTNANAQQRLLQANVVTSSPSFNPMSNVASPSTHASTARFAVSSPFISPFAPLSPTGPSNLTTTGVLGVRGAMSEEERRLQRTIDQAIIRAEFERSQRLAVEEELLRSNTQRIDERQLSTLSPKQQQDLYDTASRHISARHRRYETLTDSEMQQRFHLTPFQASQSLPTELFSDSHFYSQQQLQQQQHRMTDNKED